MSSVRGAGDEEGRGGVVVYSRLVLGCAVKLRGNLEYIPRFSRFPIRVEVKRARLGVGNIGLW